MTTSPLAARLAAGPQLGVTPAVVDVPATAPANPPEQLQVEFVGLSALARLRGGRPLRDRRPG